MQDCPAQGLGLGLGGGGSGKLSSNPKPGFGGRPGIRPAQPHKKAVVCLDRQQLQHTCAMMVLVLLLLSTSSTDAAEASRLSNSSCWYCRGTWSHIHIFKHKQQHNV